MTRWVALIAGLLAAGPAEAQCLGFQCPPGVLGGGTSGVSLPLDRFTTPSGAYSFRKLRMAYAGPAVKLQRVDTTTQDIGFVGSNFDTAAATTFCTTACTINTMYDQSGNGRHLVQATAASQPGYLASCIGALPCMQALVGAQSLSVAGTFTPATGVVTLNAIARRITGTGGCTLFRQNAVGNRLLMGAGVANQWQSFGGTAGTINGVATDAAWHTATGVINGASSVFGIDGVEVTGSQTGSTTAGQTLAFSGSGTATCAYTEAVHWDNYALPPTERTALTNNQREYWTPLPLDTFTAPSGAYSFRKLKSTYSGSAIRIRRASDNAELDINFLGFTSFTGAPWDSAAAAAHCAATTCFGRTWYDQSGVARDLVQTTAANQPQVSFNCQGTLPCWRTTAATQTLLTSATVTPATGVVGLSVVAKRDGAATGACVFIQQNGLNNRINGNTGVGTWIARGGGAGFMTVTAANDNWHASAAAINGAGSAANTDGVEVAASAAGNVTAGSQGIVGAAATTCNHGEAIVWDNYPLTLTERAALVANQRGFWASDALVAGCRATAVAAVRRAGGHVSGRGEREDAGGGA